MQLSHLNIYYITILQIKCFTYKKNIFLPWRVQRVQKGDFGG